MSHYTVGYFDVIIRHSVSSNVEGSSVILTNIVFRVWTKIFVVLQKRYTNP